MKKAIIILLALVMLLSLVACGGGTTTSSQTSVPTTTQNQDEPKTESSKTDVSKDEKPKTEEKGVLPIEVKEFGYSINGDYLYYSIHLYNPNDSYIIGLPTFRITARDADGVPLGTEEQTLMGIYPLHDSWHAFMAFSVEEEPETVDVEVLPAKDYNIQKVSRAEHQEFIPLEVINYAIRDGSIGKKLVGEVKNNNDYDIRQAVVTIVFRDENGDLIGGDSCFVDDIPAGGTASFENSLYVKFITDTYEVYADNWS